MNNEMQDPHILLDCISSWAERLSNCKAATQIPMPAELHARGQADTIELTLREMRAVLELAGIEAPTSEP